MAVTPIGVNFWSRPIALLFAALIAIAGCQKPDEIVSYTVAKPPPHEGKSAASGQAARAEDAPRDRKTMDQLVGAIVPRGQTTWFFKMTGASPAVESQSKALIQFLKSIRFEEKGPVWELPPGWEREPGSAMRFATLRIATPHGRLEMSVIPLPTGDGDRNDYLLSNINRWRDQMHLAAITKEELPESSIEFEIDGSPAWLTTFKGELQPTGMASPPFAGGAGPLAAQGDAPPVQSATELDTLPFDCSVPEGWEPARINQMQIAKYEIRDGDRQAAVTVSTAGGGLVANVNRWRGQVGLQPLDAATLDKELRKIEVDGHEAVWVALVGPEESQRRESILGVIVTAAGKQWFIKLHGDAELAARELKHFEEFVQSIRFRK